MADLDDTELDKAFRASIEGQHLDPPPAVWTGIRVAALERQFVHYRTLNGWLKGFIGVLVALLGGAVWLLLSQPEPARTGDTAMPEPMPQPGIIRTDTVYLTRTERIFVPIRSSTRPAPPHSATQAPAGAQLDGERSVGERRVIPELPEPAPTTPDSVRSDARRLLKAGSGYGQLFAPLLPRPQAPGADSFRRRLNPETENFSGIDGSNERSSSEVPRAEVVNQEKARNRPTALNALRTRPYRIRTEWQLPDLRWRTTALAPIAPYRPRPVRTPLLERLSLAAYAAPEWNNLVVRRGERGAFDYANEGITGSTLLGVRLGIRLDTRLMLLMGVESSRLNFEESEKKLSLVAESYDGGVAFVYRTAFGTALIPNEALPFAPKPGDALRIATYESTASFWRVPIGLRYDWWSHPLRLFDRQVLHLNLYSTGGVSLTIPDRQEVRLEGVNSTGLSFSTTLTGFTNLRPAWGLHAAVGAELGFGKKLHLFAEPGYAHTITSLVAGMPIRSLMGGLGVKFGTRWQFK